MAWSTVTGDGFTISMPGQPKKETSSSTQDGHKISRTEWGVAVLGGPIVGQYLVSKVEYGTGAIITPSNGLKGAATSTGGTLASSKTLTRHGLKGMDGVITGAKGNTGPETIWMRVLVQGTTAYFIEFATSSIGTSTPPAPYTQMADSFKPA